MILKNKYKLIFLTSPRITRAVKNEVEIFSQ